MNQYPPFLCEGHDNVQLKRTILNLAYCRVLGGDRECPLQACQLNRSSESTQLLNLRRDVAIFDSNRAPDDF